MPDASPHCKFLTAKLRGALTERPAATVGVAKASDGSTALLEIDEGLAAKAERLDPSSRVGS
jgi:hypothetical protein